MLTFDLSQERVQRLVLRTPQWNADGCQRRRDRFAAIGGIAYADIAAAADEQGAVHVE